MNRPTHAWVSVAINHVLLCFERLGEYSDSDIVKDRQKTTFHSFVDKNSLT